MRANDIHRITNPADITLVKTLLSSYPFPVSTPRRFNVMDVVWTSKRRRVLTGKG